MKKYAGILLGMMLLTATESFSQEYFRISADFSVKSKLASGEQSLTMGRVAYDRNQGQILYHMNFPDFVCFLKDLILLDKCQQVKEMIHLYYMFDYCQHSSFADHL